MNEQEMINEKMSNSERSTEQPPRSVAWEGDVYSQVLGNEKSGYVRGLGLGPTPFFIWGSRSSLGNIAADDSSNEGAPKPTKDVPATTALARILSAVNPVVKAYDKQNMAKSGTGHYTKITNDPNADRDETVAQIGNLEDGLAEGDRGTAGVEQILPVPCDNAVLGKQLAIVVSNLEATVPLNGTSDRLVAAVSTDATGIVDMQDGKELDPAAPGVDGKGQNILQQTAPTAVALNSPVDRAISRSVKPADVVDLLALECEAATTSKSVNMKNSNGGAGYGEKAVKFPATVGANLEVAIALNANVDRAAPSIGNIGAVAPVESVEKSAILKNGDQAAGTLNAAGKSDEQGITTTARNMDAARVNAMEGTGQLQQIMDGSTLDSAVLAIKKNAAVAGMDRAAGMGGNSMVKGAGHVLATVYNTNAGGWSVVHRQNVSPNKRDAPVHTSQVNTPKEVSTSNSFGVLESEPVVDDTGKRVQQLEREATPKAVIQKHHTV
ncbi:hypothetical protein A4A49_33982 [Nicotiana attenuata]|uniref:Uncharacterized protein n=1 Tax=Nicotiana attenuata TaxID=49451 RepID=A0A1J6IQZ0_NICAT|nr:hypothetical protein A4A49_33982 [Nicotiana attenuata]